MWFRQIHGQRFEYCAVYYTRQVYKISWVNLIGRILHIRDSYGKAKKFIFDKNVRKGNEIKSFCVEGI